MSRLNAFLHPVDLGEVKEVIISSRFKDEAGNPVPFTIRAITQEQNDALTAKCRRVQKVRGQRQEYLDAAQLNRELIVAATLEPDFSSAEVCEAYGTKIPTQVPGKMLLAGEYDALLREIMALSGFDAGAAEALEDEAKN
ncbi:MAG: phage portal protein [Oscillospiraceae bacterium]|nr:phage portal protein [Oscillospiraceae bacterium]MCI8878280.1 phage portal protein [Oscillospiraceae bacterium]